MNNLKRLRERYSLTVRKLQEHIGLDYTRVSYLEKYGESLNYNTALKFMNFYNVTCDYLMGNSPLGFIVLYEYEGKEEKSTITEGELDDAKKQHCLWEEVTDKEIIHHIRGRLAKRYFEKGNDVTITIDIKDLMDKYRQLDDESKKSIQKKMDIMLMKLKVEEMQRKIDEMEKNDSDCATENTK